MPARLLCALICFTTMSTANAGGGWVGNSPITYSYQPTTIFTPDYDSQVEKAKEEEPLKWNSLLLPKGQSRVSLNYLSDRVFKYENRNGDTFNFSYDHAFTENLTTFSFINWGYSLKSGNGLGHEWALYFGLVDGFGYSDYSGLLLGPGIGFGYSFSEPKWRFAVKSIGSGMYSFGNSDWTSGRLRTSFEYSRWLSEKFALGIGTTYFASRYRVEDYSLATNTTVRHTKKYSGFGSKSVYGAYRLSKEAEVKLIYDDYSGVGAGLSYTW